MPDPRDLLSAYRDSLKSLRRGAGPAGVLVAPLQLQTDLIDQLLQRQHTLEKQVSEARRQLEAVYELAPDAPAAPRTQAKAFSAASLALEQPPTSCSSKPT